MAKVNITTPVGRIVMGSLYKPNTLDADGNPLVFKTGPNKGQPRQNYFFALAIQKGAETHWAHTAWGQIIWNEGNLAFPNVAQSPAFAWKVEDGDSSIPNKKGRKPCDTEGYKGHWIIKLSSSFASKIYQTDAQGGYVQVLTPDFLKPGYYAQVALSVEGNGSQSQPGVYLNHQMVCFSGYGQEISFGPDVASAGFGQSAMPAGVSSVPLAGLMPPPMQSSAAPAMPAPPAAPVAPAMPSIPVMPNMSFAQMPAPPAPLAPPAPPAPPAPAANQMTALANGMGREQYIQAGWSDIQLIQAGMMTA